jgi:hypothetical protein
MARRSCSAWPDPTDIVAKVDDQHRGHRRRDRLEATFPQARRDFQVAFLLLTLTTSDA